MAGSLTKLSCAMIVLACGMTQVTADPVLFNHDDSLTSYLPTAASGGQDIRPIFRQRGTHIDGGLKSAFPLDMAVNANPHAESWNRNVHLEDIRVDVGAYAPTVVDLAMPGPGVRWVIGRTYNSRQETSGAAHRDSNGYQGRNWFQTSQPEIVFFDADSNPGTEEVDDMVYLIYGADRYLEFRRVMDGESPTDVFRGVNGAAGAFEFTEGGENVPDLFVYTDQHSNEMTFFGFDADSDPAEGQFWKLVDADGNAIYVGDKTTAATALSGYTAEGYIEVAYDAVATQDGRRYTYDYDTIDSVVRLISITVEVKTGGTWASPSGESQVALVEYDYYTGDDDNGDDGCLKLVTVTTPLSSESGENLIRKTHYRYYTGPYHTDTHPGEAYMIKYVLEAEGYRKRDWANSTFDDTPLADSDGTIDSYASYYFQYDSSYRVRATVMNGMCGCAGGASGAYGFTYATNAYTNDAGYDAADADWALRTVIIRPDLAYESQYFDEVGQPISRVLSDADPTGGSNKWVTYVDRNANGQIASIHSPDNNTAYTHSTGSFTSDADDGLVTFFKRHDNSTDAEGLCWATAFAEGTGGTQYFIENTYIDATETVAVGAFDIARPVRSTVHTVVGAAPEAFVTYDEPNAEEILDEGFSFALSTRTYHSGTLVVETNATTLPVIVEEENGNEASDVVRVAFRADGTQSFSKTADGIVTYTEFNTFGLLSKRIEDADTTALSPPTNFGSSGTELHLVTDYTYDPQGRVDTVTMPDGRITKRFYSMLDDGRMITLSFPKMTTGGSTTFYGPVGYTVSNLAGQTELHGTIAMSTSTTALSSWINEAEDDPVDAVLVGTVTHITEYIHDDSGHQVQAVRAYFDVPSPLSSAGEGTHYDTTFYGYDGMGRKWRVKEPSGTIMRTEFDAIGRVKQTWVGTNDYAFTDGEGSGPDNMVKISENVYDGGSVGKNSHLTKETRFVASDATDKRETLFFYDLRGRMLLQTNMKAPHQFYEYDERNNVIAVGLFSSVASIDLSTDTPTAEATNRLALTETAFDDRNHPWLVTKHRIIQSTGAKDTGYEIITALWYDSEGRVIKNAGESVTKWNYDRVGKTLAVYTIGEHDDALYGDTDNHADAVDLTNDIVLHERQSYFDDSNSLVMMSVDIARAYDDYGGGETTGPLDTDTDYALVDASEVEGRVQITAFWYDSLNRRTDAVRYGTYNDADFDRDDGGFASPPSSGPTALRTIWAYNTDGTLLSVTDPEGIVTRFEYDDSRRQTKVISNYVDGSPGSGDDDQITAYVYTDGLRTKVIADLSGTDQETIYTYGTTSTATNVLTTGHLLFKIQYPDSAGGADVVQYGYNAQSEMTYMKDQEGNEIMVYLDTGGRPVHRSVDVLAGGFDGAVRRISTAYDNRGLVTTITQHSDEDPPDDSVVDQVQYTYDDWGNVTNFKQDLNGTIAGGAPYSYDFTSTWSRSAPANGRQVYRRTGVGLSSAGVSVGSATYAYSSGNDYYDDEFSRVTDVTVSAVVVASYRYEGMTQVARLDYPEPDVYCSMIPSAVMDRFNRTTSNTWTKDLASDKDFYDIDITWDLNSNITLINDHVRENFDWLYAVDDLDRLTTADRGFWNGAAIIKKEQGEVWTLSLTGNWEVYQLDLNGDTDYLDSDELDDDQVFTLANELDTRDIESDTSIDYTIVCDDVGNMIDDGVNYEFIYDGFGRLRKITDRSDVLLQEFRYNGLGYRIAMHYDVDGADGLETAANGDPWYYFAYDTNWRVVGTFREEDGGVGGDDVAKEWFVYHADGLNGNNPDDRVIFRMKETTVDWEDPSTTALDERLYYCQNFRGDVVELIKDGGVWVESYRYSAYGVPFGIPLGDVDGNGETDSADLSEIATIAFGGYEVRGDLNLDGLVNASDSTICSGNSGALGGYNRLSEDPHSSVGGPGNRKGYGGYEYDAAIHTFAHVRHRVLDTEMGRWLRRDPLGYVDGLNLYEAFRSQPTTNVDLDGYASIDLGCRNPIYSEPDQACLSVCLLQAGRDCVRFCSLAERCRTGTSNFDDLGGGGQSGPPVGCTGWQNVDLPYWTRAATTGIVLPDGITCLCECEYVRLQRQRRYCNGVPNYRDVAVDTCQHLLTAPASKFGDCSACNVYCPAQRPAGCS